MFDVTNFRLVLGICIVHVVIFIKKYLVKLYRIRFCELLKILIIQVDTFISKYKTITDTP